MNLIQGHNVYLPARNTVPSVDYALRESENSHKDSPGSEVSSGILSS